LLLDRCRRGITAGRKKRYHKKYYYTQRFQLGNLLEGSPPLTCDVQTLLKVTNTIVWIKHANTKSYRHAKTKPAVIAATICGMKAEIGCRAMAARAFKVDCDWGVVVVVPNIA
jgi:hypothetical protein